MNEHLRKYIEANGVFKCSTVKAKYNWSIRNGSFYLNEHGGFGWGIIYAKDALEENL